MYKDRMMNLMREVFELMQKEGRRSNIDIENVYNFEQKLAKVSPITVRNWQTFTILNHARYGDCVFEISFLLLADI